MLSKELKDMTYNDLAFMSFGEAQGVKHLIENLLEENKALRSKLPNVTVTEQFKIW